MRAGHKFVSLHVSPWLDIVVPSLSNNSARIPILFFPRDEISAFKQKDFLTGRCQAIRQRPASGSGSNDDHVVMMVCAHCITSTARCRERGLLFLYFYAVCVWL